MLNVSRGTILFFPLSSGRIGSFASLQFERLSLRVPLNYRVRSGWFGAVVFRCSRWNEYFFRLFVPSFLIFVPFKREYFRSKIAAFFNWFLLENLKLLLFFFARIRFPLLPFRFVSPFSWMKISGSVRYGTLNAVPFFVLFSLLLPSDLFNLRTLFRE